jgi:hypothetical protein
MPHQLGYWVKQIYVGLCRKRTTEGRRLMLTNKVTRSSAVRLYFVLVLRDSGKNS